MLHTDILYINTYRLRTKWRRIMENPPPVTSETRPDIIDKDVLKTKQKEMRQFGAALRAFESDPQFNPLLVVLAHTLTRYGVPPPESEDTQVWRTWYEEVQDKYHVGHVMPTVFVSLIVCREW